MIIRNANRKIDFIFPALMFFVFAILALMVILFSAGVYKSTVDRSIRSCTAYAATSYITEKIHSAGQGDLISTGDFDGCDSIIIHDSKAKDSLVTYIYYSDGHLKELYTRPGAGATAASGNDILEIEALSLDLSDGILTVDCTGRDNDTDRAIIAVRGSEAQR